MNMLPKGLPVHFDLLGRIHVSRKIISSFAPHKGAPCRQYSNWGYNINLVIGIYTCTVHVLVMSCNKEHNKHAGACLFLCAQCLLGIILFLVAM